MLQGLERRAEAARELITRGDVDPYEVLSYVVWPTERLAESPGRQRRKEWPPEVKAEAVALKAQGLSLNQVAARVAVPPARVKSWCWPLGYENQARRRRVKKEAA